MTEQYCPHTCQFIFQYCVEIAYLLYHKSMIYKFVIPAEL